MLNKKQFRILVWLVIVLLALNVSALGTFIWLRANHPKPHYTVCDAPGKFKRQSLRMHDERIRQEVGFNDDQMEAFSSLRETHFQEIRKINNELKSTRAAHYQEIRQPEIDFRVLDSLNSRVGELHANWSGSATRFLLGAREICTPEQIPDLFRVIMESKRKRDHGMHHGEGGHKHHRKHRCTHGDSHDHHGCRADDIE